jgi:alpha-amylase
MKKSDLYLSLPFLATHLLKKPILFFILCLAPFYSMGQNDVMLQAFYWDVPVNADQKDGFWWDHLTHKAPALKQMGITALWVPSPAKGNWGIFDMGYGIYDHFDLGNYEQKGSVETRFGSRSELENMIAAMHDTAHNQPIIKVYADIILNHIYRSDENA